MIVTDHLTLASPYSLSDQTDHVPVVQKVIEEPIPGLIIDFISTKGKIRRTVSLHNIVWNTAKTIPHQMSIYTTGYEQYYAEFIILQLSEPYRNKITAYVDTQINKEDKRNEVL